MENFRTVLVRAAPQQTLTALQHRYDPEGPLTLAQHIERAEVLGALDYAKNKQIYWALVPENSPKTQEILSSVSTIVRKVLIQCAVGANPGTNSENMDFSPLLLTAFSITHVYTPKELRKRGYATRMMSLLHAQLAGSSSPHHPISKSDNLDEDREEYPTGVLSFLYSGVGDFYSKCGLPGWHIQTSTETYWDVQSVLSRATDDLAFNVKYLTEADFANVAERDAFLLTQELTSRAREGKPRAFAILPTGDEFAWLVARSKFYGSILSSSCPLPIYWGVKIDDDNFAIWFVDYVKKQLQFLRVQCLDGESLRAIVHAVAKIAVEQDCAKILAWNLDDTLLEESKSLGIEVKSQVRTKNLAAALGMERENARCG